jgi:3-methyladenine DNA glycosylase AlkD
VLASHPPAFACLTDRLAETLARGLADWGSVDLFGVTVLGQAWREGLVSDRQIAAWARSTDRWRRRLALVATVPLNTRARGGTGDPRRTLRVCRLLMNDSDDMVVNAMSWALRSLATHRPTLVREFIEREDHRLHSRIKREVLNKIRTGVKSARSRVVVR